MSALFTIFLLTVDESLKSNCHHHLNFRDVFSAHPLYWARLYACKFKWAVWSLSEQNTATSSICKQFEVNCVYHEFPFIVCQMLHYG